MLSQDENDVIAIGTYYPYSNVKQDEFSRHVLNCKSTSEFNTVEKRRKALNFLRPQVRQKISEISSRYPDSTCILLVVPSSKPGRSLFQSAVDDWTQDLNVSNLEIFAEGLQRSTEIERTTMGGRYKHRAKSLVLSIDIKDKVVILIDDIYTTGATMQATKSWLEQCSPKVIVMMRLGRTVDRSKV